MRDIDEIDIRFGAWVKVERAKMGIAQRQLAQSAGLVTTARDGQVLISKLELGQRPTRLSEAVRLIAVLGEVPRAVLGTLTPACRSCWGSPPEGFTCNSCGAPKSPLVVL